jgi:hypothetical protein
VTIIAVAVVAVTVVAVTMVAGTDINCKQCVSMAGVALMTFEVVLVSVTALIVADVMMALCQVPMHVLPI